MNIIIIILLVFFIIKIVQLLNNHNKENYQSLDANYTITNLAALSRPELQSPPNIDLSKVDWTKIDDYTYSKIVCLIQGCEEKAIIKNLPVFNST